MLALCSHYFRIGTLTKHMLLGPYHQLCNGAMPLSKVSMRLILDFGTHHATPTTQVKKVDLFNPHRETSQVWPLITDCDYLILKGLQLDSTPIPISRKLRSFYVQNPLVSLTHCFFPCELCMSSGVDSDDYSKTKRGIGFEAHH